MNFGLFDILKLIGALGFFIYGMKVMSEGIQKAAGERLRQILGAMTKNRFFGVITGFLVTALVQSSSATTVMTVSFVNAGLLTLIQSAGVMMGANVGTTVTGWLVSILGFEFHIKSIVLPIIAFGMPMLFMKRGNLKSWGEFIIGFALLFLGLETLKDTVPDLENHTNTLSFLADYADSGILSRSLFVLVGAIITIVIQSSSAAMTLTFVMCYNGWIPFQIAAAMVLGENIGTTITAEIASMVGNVHAKRSARIHSLFNIIGVTWMLIAMPLFLDGIVWFMTDYLGRSSPLENPNTIPTALAFFHTVFNVSNVLLLIWFVPLLTVLARKTVPSKGDKDELFHLEYIGSGMMGTPELSLLEAGKEVAKFGSLTRKLSRLIPPLLTELDMKQFRETLDRVKKYEDITDKMEIEIAEYLSKISEAELSVSSSVKIRSMLSIINDLERIGDICYQMSKIIERKSSKKVWFTPEQRANLKEMFDLMDEAMSHMVGVLENKSGTDYLSESKSLEKSINKKRNELRKEHLLNMERGEYNFQNSIIYNDLFSSIEKIGDHIINVSEAMAGEI